MTDVQRNKQSVVEFYELAFNAKQPEQAVEKYLGPQYIQHNPQAPDGADAFIGFVTGFARQFPELSIEIKRVIGEGDIVVIHGLIKTSAEDPGTVAADFSGLRTARSSNTGTFSSRSQRRAPTTTRCSDDQRCSVLGLSVVRAARRIP